MGTRRTFSKEFKAETVALVAEQGMSINQVAKDMSLTWSQVDKWVKQAAADCGDNPSMLTTAEKDELRELRKKVRMLTMEREILKKATAFFAKESD
jgi:transposase